jgi:hypothetical protein
VTGQLIVGLRGANGTVNGLASVPHNLPPHVVEAAKVGISDMNGCYIDLTCCGICGTWTFLFCLFEGGQ